ncbi:hypothetical protein F4810DRAFT_670389 [Camillea tinctor]|nr:hypothetical protein F4810DRAFT_670389 [Camillea tinctor]
MHSFGLPRVSTHETRIYFPYYQEILHIVFIHLLGSYYCSSFSHPLYLHMQVIPLARLCYRTRHEWLCNVERGHTHSPSGLDPLMRITYISAYIYILTYIYWLICDVGKTGELLDPIHRTRGVGPRGRVPWHPRARERQMYYLETRSV